jgi:hypothetical protein
MPDVRHPLLTLQHLPSPDFANDLALALSNNREQAWSSAPRGCVQSGDALGYPWVDQNGRIKQRALLLGKDDGGNDECDSGAWMNR